MTEITLSRSGTAWLRDMAALGQVPKDGWASSPKAAYYASFDEDPSLPLPSSTPELPSTLKDLISLRAKAQDDKNDDLADQLHRQIRSAAAEGGLSSTGVMLNETA